MIKLLGAIFKPNLVTPQAREEYHSLTFERWKESDLPMLYGIIAGVNEKNIEELRALEPAKKYRTCKGERAFGGVVAVRNDPSMTPYFMFSKSASEIDWFAPQVAMYVVNYHEQTLYLHEEQYTYDGVGV